MLPQQAMSFPDQQVPTTDSSFSYIRGITGSNLRELHNSNYIDSQKSQIHVF